jgi:anti-sigma factor RsiW
VSDTPELTEEQVELLSAYLDGESDEAGRTRVEALLAAEPAARAWLEEARADGALLLALVPRVDEEALAQALRRAEATARSRAHDAEALPSAWERLRAALTPSRVTGLAVPALAICLAVLAPDRPATPPGAHPASEHPAASPTAVAAASPASAAPASPEDAPEGAPPTRDDGVAVRSLVQNPAVRTEVVARDPKTMVVAMHLPEADVDLIWMMPPGGKRTRRTR